MRIFTDAMAAGGGSDGRPNSNAGLSAALMFNSGSGSSVGAPSSNAVTGKDLLWKFANSSLLNRVINMSDSYLPSRFPSPGVIAQGGVAREPLPITRPESMENPVTGTPSGSLKDEERADLMADWKAYFDYFEQAKASADERQMANWREAAEFNKQMLKDQYKLSVEGMKEAGINPLLMAPGMLNGWSNMSAASAINPQFPSNEFTQTANTQLQGLFGIYTTLANLRSEERRAELARILGYHQLTQQAADSILRFIGNFIPNTSMVTSLVGKI